MVGDDSGEGLVEGNRGVLGRQLLPGHAGDPDSHELPVDLGDSLGGLASLVSLPDVAEEVLAREDLERERVRHVVDSDGASDFIAEEYVECLPPGREVSHGCAALSLIEEGADLLVAVELQLKVLSIGYLDNL